MTFEVPDGTSQRNIDASNRKQTNPDDWNKSISTPTKA